jgi:hypothetical protein
MTKYLITTVAGGYDDGSNAKLTAALEALFNPPTAPPVTPPRPRSLPRARPACRLATNHLRFGNDSVSLSI